MAFPTQSVTLVRSSQQGAHTSTTPTGLSFTGDFTVEAWIKTPASVPSAIDYIFFAKFPDGVNATLGGFGSSDGGKIDNAALVIFKASAEVNKHLNFLARLEWSTWYHIAWVFTSASGKFELFLNGVSQASDTTLPHSQNANTARVTIGFDDGAGTPESWMQGSVGLTRIWSTTRTASQLSTNYCTYLGSTANLDAEWGFDSGYTDNSGNGNTLTADNTPSFAADTPSTCVIPFTPARLIHMSQAVNRAANY